MSARRVPLGGIVWLVWLLVPTLLGLAALSCGDGGSPAEPGGLAQGHDQYHLPDPWLPGSVRIGLREARILVTSEINRMRIISGECLRPLQFFIRDDWKILSGSYRTASDTISIGCYLSLSARFVSDRIEWRAMISGSCGGIPWEGRSAHPRAGNPDRESLFCSGTSAIYGASGILERYRGSGGVYAAVSWQQDPSGWYRLILYRDGTTPPFERGRLEIAPFSMDRREIRFFRADTSRWDLEYVPPGDAGEFLSFARSDASGSWTIRHEIRWHADHTGEWLDYSGGGEPEVRVW